MSFPISLSSVADIAPLKLNLQGNVLTTNTAAFDCAQLADGDTLPQPEVACDWLTSEVTCTGGQI